MSVNPPDERTTVAITLLATEFDKMLLERLAQHDVKDTAAAVSMSATMRKLIRQEAERRDLMKA